MTKRIVTNTNGIITVEVVELTSDDLLEREIEKVNGFIREFNFHREESFKKWDILKTNLAVGLEDPLTEQEIQWYRDMLDFPMHITKDTTEADYPVTPERLK